MGKYGMMLVNHPEDSGKRDAIGRTVMAAIAYEEEDLLRAIMFFCVYPDFPAFKIFRHPDMKENDLSRDHLTYLLIGLKYFQQQGWLRHFAERHPWRISDKYSFTPDMWFWMKGIAGSELALWAFYRVEIFWMRMVSLWNRTIRQIAGFPAEYDQVTYDANKINDNLRPIHRVLRKILYPAYALEILGWQLYVLRDSRSKKRLQKVCLKITGRYNYLVRMLFGDHSVTLGEVNNYKHMTAWRWGVNLDRTNDRDTYIITEPSWIVDNALETDILRKVYLEQTFREESCQILTEKILRSGENKNSLRN